MTPRFALPDELPTRGQWTVAPYHHGLTAKVDLDTREVIEQHADGVAVSMEAWALMHDMEAGDARAVCLSEAERVALTVAEYVDLDARLLGLGGAL